MPPVPFTMAPLVSILLPSLLVILLHVSTLCKVVSAFSNDKSDNVCYQRYSTIVSEIINNNDVSLRCMHKICLVLPCLITEGNIDTGAKIRRTTNKGRYFFVDPALPES